MPIEWAKNENYEQNKQEKEKTPDTKTVEKLIPEESIQRVEKLINEASSLAIDYIHENPDWTLTSTWNWKEWYFSINTEPNEQDIAKWVKNVWMDFSMYTDNMNIKIIKSDADGKTVSDLWIAYDKWLEPQREIRSNGSVRRTDAIEDGLLDIINERIQNEKNKAIKRELDAAQNNEKQEKQWADKDLEDKINAMA